MLTPSLKKVTVPVGLTVLAELTVAVNVTACPTLEGFALDAERHWLCGEFRLA